MSLWFLSLAIFAAVTSVLLAAGMLCRDLSSRRRRATDAAEVELDPRATLQTAAAAHRCQSGTPARLNRAFFDFVAQSGSAVTAGAALAIVMGAAVIGAAAPLALFDSLPGAAVGVVVGPLLPLAYWAVLRRRRLARIQQLLPDTLHVLADGVRTGRGLEQALELAARSAEAPLEQELSDCVSHLRLGQSPMIALDQLVRRLPLEELRMFAAAAVVHRQTGGNLALLVERLAASARERQHLLGHLQSVTAGSRLSALGLLLVSGLAVVALGAMQPEYLKILLEHPWGIPMMGTALLLEMVGLAWVSRIMRVQY